MRLFTVLAVLLLAGSSALLGSDCSCTSPSGSCSASATCEGGCYAACGSNCSAGCVDIQQVSQVDAPTMTYSAKAVSAAELQAAVSDALGARFLFLPKKVNDQLTVEFREVPAADLLQALAKIGAVAVVEERGRGAQDKPGAARVSLRAENVDSAVVADLLRQIFGEAAAVKSAQPGTPVTLDLKNMTLRALGDTLHTATGIRVFVRPEN